MRGGGHRLRVSGLTSLLRGAAQPQEQVPGVLTHCMQREPGHGHRSTGEDATGVPADQAGRDGQAQLIDQISRGELRVEAGTALGEHAAVPVRTEALQRRVQVDVCSP